MVIDTGRSSSGIPRRRSRLWSGSPGWHNCLSPYHSDKARAGATVLVTLGNGCVLTGLEAAAGVRTESHFARPSVLRVTAPKGAFDLPGSHTRRISAVDAEVLATDVDGNPAMTAKRLGDGRVLFVNGALEADAPIAGWPLYAAAAEAAGVRRLVRGDNPAVGFTEHPGKGGATYVIAVNYGPEPATCRLSTKGRVARVFGNGTLDGDILSLPANDAVVLEMAP